MYRAKCLRKTGLVLVLVLMSRHFQKAVICPPRWCAKRGEMGGNEGKWEENGCS